MKIGQEITVKEEFKINTIVSGKVITVKEGDKGFLDSKGLIHITTGNGRGKIVKISGMDVKGYDYENISKMVLDRLNRVFNIENFFGDEEIEHKEFLEEIEDVLMDIL